MIFIEHNETGNGEITVVSLGGYLDSQTSPDLERYVDQLLGKNRKYIIFDAEKLEYLSSAGIGLILYLHKRIAGSMGVFVLCNLRNEITTLFGILGFDKVLTITRSREDAEGIVLKHIQLGTHPAPLASADGDEGITVRIIEDDDDGSHSGVPADTESTHGSGAASEDSNEESDEFEAPVVVECAECKSLIRVKKSGNYICPDCNTEFYVEEDQTVIF
ncbi:MAG TPA: STAS domain-containing protein [Spirochaetota bacterium]|nr:STAS domain-containing protein [Spirochaetota bacterium]HPJ37190.1 STAS domain-containing protein [Spirochaetota bacterium]